MNLYINPTDMPKKVWLQKYGTTLSYKKIHQLCLDFTGNLPEDTIPVIWVDNEAFSSAAVAYCQEELMSFLTPDDMRPKVIFSVPVKSLAEEHSGLTPIILQVAGLLT